MRAARRPFGPGSLSGGRRAERAAPAALSGRLTATTRPVHRRSYGIRCGCALIEGLLASVSGLKGTVLVFSSPGRKIMPPPNSADSHLCPMPIIIGSPRSGTTLLRLMLDSYPELAVPPETGLLKLGLKIREAGDKLRERFFRVRRFGASAPTSLCPSTAAC